MYKIGLFFEDRLNSENVNQIYKNKNTYLLSNSFK